MRISSALSEINLTSINGRKVYLWPSYPNSEISRIRRVSREDGSALYFQKASEDFSRRIIEALKKPPRNWDGINIKHSAIMPGILFDAKV